MSRNNDYGTPAFMINNLLAPARRPADLQSAVKKCPNLFRLCGFEIRSKGVWLLAHAARNSERSSYGS